MISSRQKIVSLNQNQNIARTLPITCQICLGKVKDPCVCPNLHTFCSACIDVWLEKGKQCPTCRVPINNENPCRKILGGVENLDEADLLKPSDFSHSSIRKARYLSVFQQYEDEIARLLKYIDSLNLEVTKLKESLRFNRNSPNSLSSDSSSSQGDMVQMFKNKFQQSQIALNELTMERDALKETNKKLDSENSILMQDTIRLKMVINEKNSQMSNKYTVAALETKLESYEKEVKQLQKALEKSDRYISELEQSDPDKASSVRSFHKENNQNSLVSDNIINTKIPQVKPNELSKSVKFSDKVDSVTQSGLNSNSMVISPSKSSQVPMNKQITITKDNFYGSPSKKSPCKSNSNQLGVKTISSFADRIKNTNGSSLTRDLFSSTDESTVNSNKAHQSSQNSLLNSIDQPSSSISNNSHTHSFLFSPMKRLRLEEYVLEKPDETINNTTLANNTTSTSSIGDDLITPPRVNNNHNVKSFSSNSQLLNSENSPVRIMDLDTKKVVSKFSLNSSQNNQVTNDNNLPKMSDDMTEFNDCLKLLNQAEKKVQKQFPSQKQNDFALPSKYFQASTNFDQNPENSENFINGSFINQNTATYNTITHNACATNRTNESSLNSMTYVTNTTHPQSVSGFNGNSFQKLDNPTTNIGNIQNCAVRTYPLGDKSVSLHHLATNEQQNGNCLKKNSSEMDKLGMNTSIPN